MQIKPNIFIGSSKEGLPAAELIKKHLSDFADCRLWNEEVFTYNNSYFDTLNEILSFYDYGIMVASADDLIASRGKTEEAMRDNILFEFGLFLGRMGRNRVFMFKEKGVRLPSDLTGIALPSIPELGDPELEAKIKENCNRIINNIEARSGIFDGGIFPAVPLAYGYFYNSILPACRQLMQDNTVRIHGEARSVDAFKFSILIPDDLRSDMKEKVEVARLKDKWVQVEIPTSATRSYNFYLHQNQGSDQPLVICDIPTTLNSLHQTIAEFVGTTALGRSRKEQLVEAREIRRFKTVLDYLIENSPFTKGQVDTQIVDI